MHECDRPLTYSMLYLYFFFYILLDFLFTGRLLLYFFRSLGCRNFSNMNLKLFLILKRRRKNNKCYRYIKIYLVRCIAKMCSQYICFRCDMFVCPVEYMYVSFFLYLVESRGFCGQFFILVYFYCFIFII